MAHGSLTVLGPVISLNHQETQDVLSVAADVAEVAHRIASYLDDGELAVVGFALEAIAVGISLNVILIEAVDKGYGVYITSPWLALGTIIPTTYPPDVGLPSDWTTRATGEFRTNDAVDLLQYQIKPDAVSNEIVEFRLEASDNRMWRKVLVLRDGLGSQWDISISPADGSFSASNALWADQVKNGQVLSLWKAKEFGIHTWVLDIGNLDGIQPGSSVVFTWLRDA